MIDAYEIGIQLALEDGVSAGLAVINQELAQVDRAIAATSAGLTNLTRVAETATKAAAAAFGARAVGASAPANVDVVPVADESAGGKTRVVSDAGVTPALALTRETPQSAGGELPATERAALEAGLAAAPVPLSLPAPPVTPIVMQTSGDVSSTLILQQPLSFTASPAAPRPPQEQRPVSPTVSPPQRAAQVQVPIERRWQAVSSEPSSTAAAVSDREPMTAAVARALTLPDSSAPARSKATLPPVPPAYEGRAATPFLPSAQRAPATPPMQRGSPDAETSVAPQPRMRDEGSGAGGTVMLDGRLVGYWLAEQMARDASRPPAGTTYFDSRQTPAWTASGALP